MGGDEKSLARRAVLPNLARAFGQRQIYGAGVDDGVGCVGLALGNGGVATGAVIVGALVLVLSTVVIMLP